MQNPTNVKKRCPICSHIGKNFKTFSSQCVFNKEILIRYQCPKCEVIFGNDRMLTLTNDQMAREYASVWKCKNADNTQHELSLLKLADKPKNAKYLIWGSGIWAKSLIKAKEMGYNIIGYDPYCHDNNTIRSINKIKNQKFDVIISHDVIEHLQYPIQELKLMSSMLKSDGIMIHATRCYQLCLQHTRFHLFFFVGKSSDILAKACGLKVLHGPGPNIKRFYHEVMHNI